MNSFRFIAAVSIIWCTLSIIADFRILIMQVLLAILPSAIPSIPPPSG